jgi:hypothetical protein
MNPEHTHKTVAAPPLPQDEALLVRPQAPRTQVSEFMYPESSSLMVIVQSPPSYFTPRS